MRHYLLVDIFFKMAASESGFDVLYFCRNQQKQTVTTFSAGVIFSEMGAGGSGPTVHFVYCDLVGRLLSSVRLKSRK